MCQPLCRSCLCNGDAEPVQGAKGAWAAAGSACQPRSQLLPRGDHASVAACTGFVSALLAEVSQRTGDVCRGCAVPPGLCEGREQPPRAGHGAGEAWPVATPPLQPLFPQPFPKTTRRAMRNGERLDVVVKQLLHAHPGRCWLCQEPPPPPMTFRGTSFT